MTSLNHWCCAGTHPEFLFGSAGSLVMRCPKCGMDHFRNPVNILHFDHKEFCVYCGTVELHPVKNAEVSP